jgi:hypothetical protein
MDDKVHDKNCSKGAVENVFLKNIFELQRVNYPKYQKQQINN